jgi:hypothetical protein
MSLAVDGEWSLSMCMANRFGHVPAEAGRSVHAVAATAVMCSCSDGFDSRGYSTSILGHIPRRAEPLTHTALGSRCRSPAL